MFRCSTLSQNGYGERLKAYISAYLTTNCKAREKKDKEERRRTAENENNAFTANRNYPVRQKGCAERIAPIGTLSQNGYGEHSLACTSAYLTTNCTARLNKRKTSRRNETHGTRRIANSHSKRARQSLKTTQTQKRSETQLATL